MKVYVLSELSYEASETMGVFASQELAVAAVALDVPPRWTERQQDSRGQSFWTGHWTATDATLSSREYLIEEFEVRDNQ
jgi:hypothetical protein